MVTREEPTIIYRDLSKRRSNEAQLKFYEGLDYALL